MFWRSALDAGYTDAGAPDERPRYKPDYYCAFLLDPDGNGVEAVHHGAAGRGSHIDHLWIRVEDLDAAERFYTTIAPTPGYARASGGTAASSSKRRLIVLTPARRSSVHPAAPHRVSGPRPQDG